MKLIAGAISLALLSLSPTAFAKDIKVTSPDGGLQISLSTDKAGALKYSATKDGKTVLEPSRLGLEISGAPALEGAVKIKNVRRSTFDETWAPVWGEEDSIRNHYNELAVEYEQSGRKLGVVFRVFDDGFGFRYEFPRQSGLENFTITNELTEFAFPEAYRSWSIPAEKVNYYEGLYRELPLDSIGKASTPITIEGNGMVMALHEANLTDYAALNVEAQPGTHTLKAELTPWSTGELVFVTDTRVSPWRTLIVADSVPEMMLSRIMLNLNEPCAIENTEWIQPQRYIGVWWCYHKRTHTWGNGPKHGATTENVKRYMDFAARHGFGGVLVEGWNKDWWTYDFSFTEPYDDFDTDSICEYGRKLGVDFISHHETGSKVENYENQLDDAFKYCRDKGIRYVKTGYTTPLLDGKERHSSQFGVRHMRKVLETAAKYGVNIDNHEPVMPTGIQRTYPNLMTQEGVRGQEWDAWNKAGGNPPSHTVTIPFTRGLAGPMDFTPVTFDFENKILPDTRVNTTLAKQLALFLILYSPLQMASDMIENYERNPGPLVFVESCPTDWSKTLYPEAEIGKYITVARKDKNSDDWFVAGATGDDARTASFSLDFLDPDTVYTATIYRDGPDADWETNPYPVTIERKDVDSHTRLEIPIARSGGFAIRLMKK
ncbi:MAG: glycoside hydrolase family 97 protein [Bacteroidales bacterium]|nr:glycoside hydrolase family 97 protein [Bacteroidales bacterium]